MGGFDSHMRILTCSHVGLHTFNVSLLLAPASAHHIINAVCVCNSIGMTQQSVGTQILRNISESGLADHTTVFCI